MIVIDLTRQGGGKQAAAASRASVHEANVVRLELEHEGPVRGLSRRGLRTEAKGAQARSLPSLGRIDFGSEAMVSKATVGGARHDVRAQQSVGTRTSRTSSKRLNRRERR
jgi:hypothetical protein